MAAVRAPEASGLSHTSTSSSRKSAPRLRESCEPCSAAKVRCSKEKPVCTRCASRELPCKYFQTKRAGRPSTKNNGDHAKNASREQNVAAAPLAASRASAELSRESTRKPSLGYKDLPALKQDPQPNPLASPMAGTLSCSSGSVSGWNTHELDEFFASFGSVTGLHTPSTSLDNLASVDVDPSNTTMDCSDPGAFMSDKMFEDLFSGTPMLSNPHPSRHERLSRHEQPSHPCCCLMIALSLLNDATMPLEKTINQDGQPLSTIESVIAENEGIVASMDSILQCRCSQDAYVLVILSLVVFKVLGRYGRAAKVAPAVTKDNSRPSSPQKLHQSWSLGGSYVEGEDSSRVAAQLVLGELHHALRLVNELSSRCNQHRTGGHRSPCTGSRRSSAEMDAAMCDEGAAPFSPTMLDQLEADLRQRLRSVSLTIIGMLRGA